MTPEKAVEILKANREKRVASIYATCKRLAISALEKQIPQKPNLQGDGYADGELVYDYAECPVCNCDFEEDTTNWGCKFCPDCGQALDWSES